MVASPDTSRPRSAARVLDKVRTNWQTLFNKFLFLVFSAWAGRQTWRVWAEGRLDYVEVAFAVQNVILVSLILLRKPHREVDHNAWHQLVALVAFCSGMFFIGQPVTGSASIVALSKLVVFTANVLGAVSLLNLGRSFGILIALRDVRTRGLYSFVRHPMYGTDILLRIGFLISHFTWVTTLLFTISTACYVYRAILEERFLSREPEYREYMHRVRYRFIPGVF